MKNKKNINKKYLLVMILYLAGIFMGAIDTGIVTPARTIIQNEFGVSAQSGIWMITIYTLAYAVSVPIMGKLADKFGRKKIYITCITLFGLGSLFCGLSGSIIGFPLLIIARVVQAIGGGGIVPIATAEFGTTFPKEKRGLALGLVGGVYGIANVFGASAGSAIMDLFGTSNWEFIFYINVPISLFIIICGIFALKNNRDENNKEKLDLFGIFTLTVMILSLLYGFKNLDFFDFVNSLKSINVYPFLLTFIFCIPIFILAEKKAIDPVISLSYFTNKNILITLILSTISGFVMMGVIFVPQFSENCLKIASGSGGYLVIILGLFAGLGAPISGKMIDKFGPKVILAFGFICNILGSLFMIFVTINYPNMLTVLIGLALVGLGTGFTMGTPINYMMLADTDPKKSNSALATVSLVRSIGTAIAPAIMIGFISSAGMSLQGNIMEALPDTVEIPEIKYVKEINKELGKMKKNPQLSSMIKNMDYLEDMLNKGINMKMDMSSSDIKIPKETLQILQSSDVTNIVDNTKIMSKTMFGEMKDEIVKQISSSVQQGIDSIDKTVQTMNNVSFKTEDMNEQIDSMKKLSFKMKKMKNAIPKAFDTAFINYTKDIEKNSSNIEKIFQDTLNKGFSNIYLLITISSGLALVILAFYKRDKKSKI